MPFDRRSLLAAGAVTALGTRRARVQAQEAKSLSIALDWYPNSNHAGLFWAEAEGLFANAGLDVSLVTPADPSTVLQTVGAGRDTFGISYQPDILLARAQDVPVRAVAAIVPRPLQGVMVLQSADITRPADLAGKIVGYPGIPSQEAFLRTMLETDGLSLDDITLNNVEFSLLPSLISNAAAAVMGAFWTHETIVAEREGYPVDMLKVEEWGVPSYAELVLVTSEEFAEAQPEAVAQTVLAMREGYLAAAADQARALQILSAAYPETDLGVEKAGIALLAEIWSASDPGFGVLEPGRWDAFVDWMKEAALLPPDFELGETLVEGILSPATPTASPAA